MTVSTWAKVKQFHVITENLSLWTELSNDYILKKQKGETAVPDSVEQ